MSDNRLKTDPPITQPFFNFQTVTQRLPRDSATPPAPFATTSNSHVTQRYRADVPELATGNSAQMLIAGRYQCESTPLGTVSGEADVYKSVDQHQQDIVALKLYRYDATPKDSVIQRLQGLAHPNVVTLYDYGHWQGRFFEVMEFCAGGAMSESAPFAESRLRDYFAGINNGLQYCHMQGIVHRDIKPNNLFFREAEQKTVLIGDFGISSYIENTVRVTQNAAHLTLDYAAPELLDGHQVSEKTDYYALGISLIHLLLGHSPWQGLSQNDILVAHLRGRVPLPDNCSEEFLHVLRGLTLVKPEQRWGYAEIQAWLQGESVALTEPEAEPIPLSTRPYPGYRQALQPAQLAQALDKFDAFTQLCRGDIRRWVFDYFDATMAQRLEILETDCQSDVSARNAETKEKDVLERLFYILAPQASLRVGDKQLDNLQQLGDLLVASQQQASLQKDLEYLLWNGVLTTWIEVRQLAGSRTNDLLEKIRALSLRLRFSKFAGITLFSLLYTLDPQRPLPLTPKIAVNHPGELKAAIAKSPKAVMLSLRDLLYSKRLEEWLQAAEFTDWQNTVTFLSDVRQRYLEHKDIGVWSVRWYFHPELAFPFRGKPAKTPAQLARMIDSSKQHWGEGCRLLKQGWIRAWLVASGKIAQPVELDHALLSVDTSWDTRLEAVLHLLDPDLPNPQPKTMPTVLNLGQITPAQPKTAKLRIHNTGRGHLSGVITIAQDRQGVTLSQYVIEGEARITVSVEVLGLMSGGRYSNRLRIHSNGGDLSIPLYFTVKPPQRQRSWWDKICKYLANGRY